MEARSRNRLVTANMVSTAKSMIRSVTTDANPFPMATPSRALISTIREVSPSTLPGMRLLMAWQREKAVNVVRKGTLFPAHPISTLQR